MDTTKDDNAKALEITKRIYILTKRSNKIINEINTLYAERVSVCTHTKTDIVKTVIEGGYLNRTEYIKTTVCSVCNKRLDVDTTIGGFA